MSEATDWIRKNEIVEVECLIHDMNGVLRGKVLPVEKFLKALDGAALYIPTSALLVCADGRYSGAVDEGFATSDPDMLLVPDLDTLCAAPDITPPRAFVLADACYPADQPWSALPRILLKSVLALYSQKGWRAVVAPELEFYLTAPNPDPRDALTAPVATNGRRENSQHPYDIEALEWFEPVLRKIYDHCAIAGVPVDTLTHETGTAQLEINLIHGDPLKLADNVVMFKRIARKAAARSGAHATFMAKPIDDQAGSSMHLHVSVVDMAGETLFADRQGDDTPMFRHFMGGLQKYVPETMPLIAPNVNSYRRIGPTLSAPANVEWSHDNRSCGLRVPKAGRDARRVENRLPGADANPYLAIAATLLCGYLGVAERLQRAPEALGNAYLAKSTLPRNLAQALERLAACAPMRSLLGEEFFQTFARVKQQELDAFERIVTPWEREHLLLKT
ncbi:MAG: glutamine synthetase family protein [Hyphomicrobiales bacterium]|nr:glutamine synthetase family protein [Hyphomicrobiales bacterium]